MNRPASGHASSDLLADIDAARRKHVERGFGERVRSYINGNAPFVEAARKIGVKRAHLYKVLDGFKPMPAAWLELLPPVVELEYMAERARAHGLRLMPVITSETTLFEVFQHVGGMMASCAESEKDGHVDTHEAERDLKILRPLLIKLLELIAHRERALITPGGLSVCSSPNGTNR